MYRHIYIYIYIHIYVYIHIYICHIYSHVHTHTHIYVHVYTHTYTCIHARATSTYTCLSIYTHTHIYMSYICMYNAHNARAWAKLLPIRGHTSSQMGRSNESKKRSRSHERKRQKREKGVARRVAQLTDAMEHRKHLELEPWNIVTLALTMVTSVLGLIGDIRSDVLPTVMIVLPMVPFAIVCYDLRLSHVISWDTHNFTSQPVWSTVCLCAWVLAGAFLWVSKLIAWGPMAKGWVRLAETAGTPLRCVDSDTCCLDALQTQDLALLNDRKNGGQLTVTAIRSKSIARQRRLGGADRWHGGVLSLVLRTDVAFDLAIFNKVGFAGSSTMLCTLPSEYNPPPPTLPRSCLPHRAPTGDRFRHRTEAGPPHHHRRRRLVGHR